MAISRAYSNRLTETIRLLCDRVSSEVVLNINVRDLFRTSIFFPNAISYVSGKYNAEDCDTSASIGGRTRCNLRFADDIDLPERAAKNSNSSPKEWIKRRRVRNGNQPRQPQIYCQQHQVKALFQHMGEWESARRCGSNSNTLDPLKLKIENQ